MLIDENTTFIVQGITGREAVNLTRECLDYGSKIVGGVTPGRRGREVHGVPVFDSVAQLVDSIGSVPDGSVVTVPPAFTRYAVFEAIEGGIKLIVIVTERIPRYDVAQTPYGPECDCPDFIFRRAGLDPHGCKHVRALVACGLIDG